MEVVGVIRAWRSDVYIQCGCTRLPLVCLRPFKSWIYSQLKLFFQQKMSEREDEMQQTDDLQDVKNQQPNKSPEVSYYCVKLSVEPCGHRVLLRHRELTICTIINHSNFLDAPDLRVRPGSTPSVTHGETLRPALQAQQTKGKLGSFELLSHSL